jgi:hypothetical protein
MLDASDPIPLIWWMVSPLHPSLAVSLIILKIPYVSVPWWPCISSFTTFLVISILPFVSICNYGVSVFLPFSEAMLQPLNKIANVNRPVFPFIGSLAVWCTFCVLTAVLVPIGKCFSTSPVFHESEPLPLVFITIRPHMNSISMSFWVLPLSDIMVSLSVFPKPLSLLHPTYPVTIIDLPISPLIDPSAMRFTVWERSSVDISRSVSFIPLTMSNVFYPESFIESSIDILHDALSLTNFGVFLHLSHVEGIFVLQHFEVRNLSQDG